MTDLLELSFHTLDVFTDRAFGGNPLGIFPEATHLPTTLMQRIAREMNLSETVFVGPPDSDECSARVRIFTPGVEVPFAGHPTVGTAIFLANAARGDEGSTGARSGGPSGPGAGSGRRAPSDHAEPVDVVLEENVGPVPVEVTRGPDGVEFARFTTALLPEHRPSPHEPAELAAMVGVDASEVCPNGMPVEMVSCGLPYHVVPVASLDAVRGAQLDMARWRSMLADSWAHHVYLVCLEAEGDDVDVHVRMFAPGSGVPEDPATGSAAAALGGYLSELDGSADARLSWTVEQGIEMGRPSMIQVEADRAGGRTTAVRVGGSAVLVSSGIMRVPV